MISVYSVLFVLVLSSHLVAVATIIEDGVTEQDALGSLFEDEPVMENAVVPLSYRRRLMLDNMRDEDGKPHIIVSDVRPRGRGAFGGSSAFTRRLPLLTDPSLKIDRRDTDLDMLRCMIGRVYRPCWKV